jgi:hypothetical protein
VPMPAACRVPPHTVLSSMVSEGTIAMTRVIVAAAVCVAERAHLPRVSEADSLGR